MTTVNSADKMQRLVSLKTTFVWTCMKGDLFFGLKFGVYYFSFHCKGVLISGGVLLFSGWGGGGGGGRLSVEFYGYVTKHNYSFQ